MMRRSLFILCCALCHWSCKKEVAAPKAPEQELHTDMQEGLPANMTRVHGFFYSMRTWYTQNGHQYQHDNFVNFSVHGGDLRKGPDLLLDEFDEAAVTGDLAVGTLQLNTYSIMPYALTGPRFFYRQRTFEAVTVTDTVAWRYSGTADLSADSFIFHRPYPQLLTRSQKHVLDTTAGFSVLVDTVISNFHEASIALMGDHYRGGPYIVLLTNIHPELRHFNMTASQVKTLLTPDGASPPRTLRFKGYRHFHKYHHGRLLVFTFAAMVDYEVTIYN